MKSALSLRYALACVGLFLIITASPSAQTQTVGLFQSDTAAYSGYTLFAPMRATTAYLIDPYGRLVHTWENTNSPGADVYFLPNGHLMWPEKTPAAAQLKEFDWDGNAVWEWQDTSSAYNQHHDIQPLPNGNVLILTNYFRTATEAFDAGRDTLRLSADTLQSIMIREIHPTGPTTGDVVWEWYLWDHLIQDFDPSKDNYGVVADHPELMDINIGSTVANWVHANSVAYDPDLDQIMLSFRTISEIFVIDHSTTTAEAAGHTGGAHGRGGDFLYRWGNPQNYRAGDATDQQLDYQHDAHWIAGGLPGEGHMLVFNNGNTRGYSSVDEITLPIDGNGDYTWPSPGQPFGPAAPSWSYQAPPESTFAALSLSGAQRQPNGNTLINDGPAAHFFEVTAAGEIVWDYRSPVKNTGPVAQGTVPSLPNVFRAYRFGSDFAGLAGKDLTPGAALEIYPVTISGSAYAPTEPVPSDTAFTVTATITAGSGTVMSAEVQMDRGAGFEPFTMYDDGLHNDSAAGDNVFGAVIPRPPIDTTVRYYIEAISSLDSLAVDPANPPVTAYRFESGVPCGNIDGAGDFGTVANISDLTYLVAFLFQGGPAPADLVAANIDGSTGPGDQVNVSDLTYLVAFLFQGGPAPTC